MNFAMVMFTVAAFILVLVGGLAFIANHEGKKVDPEKLLAERFARGEIDEREYARRLSILRYGPPLEID